MKNAEVSNMFQKDFIDRENKRKKRKRNVIEMRKDEVQKRDNRWTNGWTKGHKEVTHACKKWKIEEFFWYNRKVKLLFKKVKESEGKEKWVQEEGDQENKKIKQKRIWKKDERKIFMKENHKMIFRKRFSLSNRRIFLK